MKKLANKLRRKKPIDQTVKDKEEDPKYPVEGPVPAPKPYGGTSGEPDPQEDVVTFSGFGDWMGKFKPDPIAMDLVEADAEPATPRVDELLTMPGYFHDDMLLSLVLSGLRKPWKSATYTVQITGPWFMTLRTVNRLLAESGYEKMVSARRADGTASNWSADKALPTSFEVPVIDGPSVVEFDGPEPLLLIGRDEWAGIFVERVRRLRVRCLDGRVVASSFPAELEIGFNRTLRMPEDGKTHNQPARLDGIGVHSIAAIAKKLEASRNRSLVDMARKGGVFFPLYQREALFLSFAARYDAFALRVLAGGVNAVSGLAWNADPRRTRAQDYLAVPPQQFLDGVCVARDVVRQFVAMPLGSGYSVEKQVTGREDVGGMQIQIAPADGWVLRTTAEQDIVPHASPRLFNAEVLNFDRARGWVTDEELEEKKRFFDEIVPVYMRHLYQSQCSPPPRSHVDAHPFRAGLTVVMDAVYLLNVTLIYRDRGQQHLTTVEWAPWWPLERCFAERRAADFQIDDTFIDEWDLVHQNYPLRRGRETLQEQNVRDGAVILLQPRGASGPGPPLPHAGYSGSQYHGDHRQSAPAPGWNYQAQAAPAPRWDEQPSGYAELHSAPPFPQSQQDGRILAQARPASPTWEEPPSPVSQQQSLVSSNTYTQSPSYEPASSSPETLAPQGHSRPWQVPSSSARPPKSSSSRPWKLLWRKSGSSSTTNYGEMDSSANYGMVENRMESMPPPPRIAGHSMPAAMESAGYSSMPPVAEMDGSVGPYRADAYYPAPQSAPGLPSAPPASAPSQYAQSPSSPSTGWDAESRVYTSQSPSAPTLSSPPTSTGASPVYGSGHYGQQQAYRPPSPALVYDGPSARPNMNAAYSSRPSAQVPSPPPKPQDQTGWAMGLAAGTRIRQAILRDPWGAAAWSRTRATILSVQILNSVAFEALTGLAAPACPITPQTYLAHGLPFFASYAEGVDADGGTTLAGLRSVGDIDADDGTIRPGVDASGGGIVGCTCCGTRMCDSILRPCNHSFCSSCIGRYMTFDKVVYCKLCRAKVTRLVGFSAPMALPGEDRVDLDKAEIITLDPPTGSVEFYPVELEAVVYASGNPGAAYELDG